MLDPMPAPPAAPSRADADSVLRRLRARRVRFWRVLLVIAFAALVIRVAYVQLAKAGPCRSAAGVVVHESECPIGDQIFYNEAANRLADGDGFVEPFDQRRLPEVVPGTAPAADHPPLTVVVLAPVSLLGGVPPLSWFGDENHVHQHRLFLALLGTGVVVLIGVLGRRVGGDMVGWVAAGIAAAYPYLWVSDGIVMSETVTNAVVVGALVLAYRFLARPCAARAVVLGVACGLATLSRAELALLVPLLAIPLAWLARAPGRRAGERWRDAGAAAGAALLVVAPWVGYNLARFEDPTTISTNDGIALAGSNCDAVYSGGGLGLTYLAPPCLDEPPPPGDQSEVATVYRRRAIDYARDHAGEVPKVVAARIGRTWGVYRPADMISFNEGEGREPWTTRVGMVAYYPLVLAAIGGAVLLARRRGWRMLWPLVVPAIVVTVGAATTYGQTRFRAAAEPSIVVLAAVAAVHVGEWWTTRRAAAPVSPRPEPDRRVAST
jgi:hypothetical protein